MGQFDRLRAIRALEARGTTLTDEQRALIVAEASTADVQAMLPQTTEQLEAQIPGAPVAVDPESAVSLTDPMALGLAAAGSPLTAQPSGIPQTPAEPPAVAGQALVIRRPPPPPGEGTGDLVPVFAPPLTEDDPQSGQDVRLRLGPGGDVLRLPQERGGELESVRVSVDDAGNITVFRGDQAVRMDIGGNADALRAILEPAVTASLREGNSSNLTSDVDAQGISLLRLTTAEGTAIMDQVRPVMRGRLSVEPPAQAGTGEPRVQMDIRREFTLPGAVDPRNAAALLQAGQRRQTAQAIADVGQVGMATARAAAIGVQAGAQEAEAAEMARRSEERAQRTEEAIGQFQERAREVSEQRIDPGQFFGGFGGRVGAAIAVAFGELGRVLTGDASNRAMDVINASIDRNIAAQRDGLHQANVGVRNEGNALNQMSALFRDQETSEAATRALHLAAVTTRLNSLIAGASAQQLPALQSLRDRVAAEAQAAGAVAADRARSMTIREDMSVRGTPAAVAEQTARFTAGPAQPQAPAPQPAPQPQVQEQLAAAPAPDEPAAPTSEGILREAAEAVGEPIPAVLETPAEATRRGTEETMTEAVDAAEAAGGPTEQTEQVRAAVRSARTRRVVTQALRVATPNRAATLAAWEAAGEFLTEEARDLAIPMGAVPQTNNPNWANTYRGAINAEGGRARLADIMSQMLIWDRSIGQITSVASEFNAEVSRGNPRFAAGQALASMSLIVTRHHFTGAQFGEREIEDWEALMPTLGDAAQSITGFWNSIENTWWAFYNAMMIRGQSALNDFGLQSDRITTIPQTLLDIMNMTKIATQRQALGLEDPGSELSPEDAALVERAGIARIPLRSVEPSAVERLRAAAERGPAGPLVRAIGTALED